MYGKELLVCLNCDKKYSKDEKSAIAGSARQTGKTVICPNCMRQFKFKHNDLSLVDREDLEWLFEKTGVFFGMDEKHFDVLKEKYLGGEETQ